jgi:hypothetical protein
MDYKDCPGCEQPTEVRDSGKSLLLKEAHSLAANARFERFYAEHDAKREGPTPEEIGAAEALAVRELEAAYGEKSTKVAELDAD